MVLVGYQVEDFLQLFGTKFCPTHVLSRFEALLDQCSLASSSCSHLVRKFPCVVSCAGLLDEPSHCGAEYTCGSGKETQRGACMETQLCVRMPCCEVEQEVGHDGVVACGQKAFKDRNSTL